MVYSGVITGQNFRGKNGAGHQEYPEPILEYTVSRDTEDTFTPNTVSRDTEDTFTPNMVSRDTEDTFTPNMVSQDTEDTFTPNTRLDECGPLWGEREVAAHSQCSAVALSS